MGITLIFSIFLFACQGEEIQDDPQTKTEILIESDIESESEQNCLNTKLPYGDNLGQGEISVSTPSGTSENGNVPVLLETEDIVIDMIGLNAWGIDGTLWSFVYIDGVLIEKTQLADTSISLTIESGALSEGEHIVSVVQYLDNNESLEIIT